MTKILRNTFIITIFSFWLFLACGSPDIESCDIDNLDAKLKELKAKDQKIRRELIKVYKKYQDTGEGLISLFLKDFEMDGIDEDNQEILRVIFEKCGWPNELNDQSHSAIFLIIDHAELDYISQYYDLVEEKYENGVLKPGSYATLTDRKLMYEGKMQLYGSQTFSNSDHPDMIVWPIKNPDVLNERRAKMGMKPIDDYFKLLEDSTGMKVNWDKKLTLAKAQELR